MAPPPHSGEALLYLRSDVSIGLEGKYVEAIAEIRQAVTPGPASPEAHFILACVLEESGEIAAATTHYRRAIEHVVRGTEF